MYVDNKYHSCDTQCTYDDCDVILIKNKLYLIRPATVTWLKYNRYGVKHYPIIY